MIKFPPLSLSIDYKNITEYFVYLNKNRWPMASPKESLGMGKNKRLEDTQSRKWSSTWGTTPPSFNCSGLQKRDKRVRRRQCIFFRTNKIKEFECWRKFKRSNSSASSFFMWLWKEEVVCRKERIGKDPQETETGEVGESK